VALSAVRGEYALAEVAEQFGLHPNPTQDLKMRLLRRAEEVFGGSAEQAKHNEQALEKRHAEVRQVGTLMPCPPNDPKPGVRVQTIGGLLDNELAMLVTKSAMAMMRVFYCDPAVCDGLSGFLIHAANRTR